MRRDRSRTSPARRYAAAEHDVMARGRALALPYRKPRRHDRHGTGFRPSAPDLSLTEIHHHTIAGGHIE